MESTTQDKDNDLADDPTGDEFQVFIDEPYLSLVLESGRYIAEVRIDPSLRAGEQEALMASVLSRAREFGLVCFASHPTNEDWVALEFYKVEDV